MNTVLIVDDSSYMRALVRIALTESGYNVIGEAADGKTALKMARTLTPDIITLDNILPDMFGVEILQSLQREEHPSKIVMVSAVGQDRIKEKVKKMGAAAYLVKPFEPEQLIETVESVSASLMSA